MGSIPGKTVVSVDETTGNVSLKCVYELYTLTVTAIAETTTTYQYDCDPYNCNYRTCNPYNCNYRNCNPHPCYLTQTCYDTCYDTCYQTCYDICYRSRCTGEYIAEFGIASSPSGISCTAGGSGPASKTCTYSFPEGTVVTLNSSGTTFTGDCSGTNACTVTMDGPKNVTGTH